MMTLLDTPPFPGFRPQAFAFLRDLARHNDRDWFKPRKQVYEDEVLWPFRCLVADVARQAAARGLPLTGDPKRSLFRIYRDTRFSKNKRPYKTHAGGVLTRSGSRKEPGGVYVHVEPGNSFLAAGFWRPESKLLRAWRLRMVREPEPLLGLVRGLEAAGLPFEADDVLKRMPRGFEAHAEADVAGLLRLKSFVVSRPFPDEALQAQTFTGQVLEMVRDVLPLLTYGWAVEDALRGARPPAGAVERTPS